MQSDWAAENLQVIRTLMERGAVYRRALAPVTACVGITGMAAAVAALALHVNSNFAFGIFWMAVAVLCLLETFFLVRRQAMRDGEMLWSPPTRRVCHALLPSFVAACVAGLLLVGSPLAGPIAVWLLISAWMVLYGCGMHAAGTFLQRGFKLLSWAFVAGGFGVLVAALSGADLRSFMGANCVMGATFGCGHCACSIYLYFTEKRRNEP